jgi:diketogulonate reductase-like aldo/keto reductase
MERRQFGSTNRQAPVIGQGTWYSENDGRAAAIVALRGGVALGMTHVDTAEMYGSGTAEEMVAAAIAGLRDVVFQVGGDDDGLRHFCVRTTSTWPQIGKLEIM